MRRAVGEAHTVVIAESNNTRHVEAEAIAYSWGDPSDSRLGGADPRRHHSPQQAAALSHALKRLRLTVASTAPQHGHSIIVCGAAHTILLTTTGHLLAWGCGKYGQLGYGNLWDREEPVVVPSLRSIVVFSAGDRHTVAVCDRAQVEQLLCWSNTHVRSNIQQDQIWVQAI
mmetsp:Transcript_31056/g.96078  ORF Transcript_31056/g.96078 Transcript_31056/m.96078 type:complete len:171 (+) Transcript_31056:1037-1549(+)